LHERFAIEARRRILDAAVAELAARGFDGARLGSIARSAKVQESLIRRYFVDMEGLLAEIVRDRFATMTRAATLLVAQVDALTANRKRGKRRHPIALRALIEAFVEVLAHFVATNGAFLSILRHETRRDGWSGAKSRSATKIVTRQLAPIVDAIVARLDEMRTHGDVRKDVESRQLVLSCVAMILFPLEPLEQAFVASFWPRDGHRREHLAERKRHVVEMILARLAL
jgi:TetR/AcrR family transcriptional regulator